MTEDTTRDTTRDTMEAPTEELADRPPSSARFLPLDPLPSPPWHPVIVRRAEIEAEIARLASQADSPSGRVTLLVHPLAPAQAPGLAPGIGVTLSVLRPGEATEPARTNATEVHFCIEGSGTAMVGDTVHHFDRYDVFNVPGYRPVTVRNDTDAIQARLVYSNRPLLQLLGVHLDDVPSIERTTDPRPAGASAVSGLPVEPSERTSGANPFGTFPVGAEDGPWLMPYERLIHPPSVPSPSLHWRWPDVKGHLDELEALGAEYTGRRLYLLFNPRTGGTNGTTPNFFATITMRPPGIVDRPHRHVSAAINYFFGGSGRSVVGGHTYRWSAGDLMLTAPGWMIHHHASDPGTDPVYELTIQDQPLHIAMESLLWQEDLKRPAVLLGVDEGFSTNRGDIAAAGSNQEEIR